MARTKPSSAHPSVVWALVLAAALSAVPSAVAQEAPPLDYDDPCQYMDPVIWAGYCGYGSGGGGSPPANCKACMDACKEKYNKDVHSCALAGAGIEACIEAAEHAKEVCETHCVADFADC